MNHQVPTGQNPKSGRYAHRAPIGAQPAKGDGMEGPHAGRRLADQVLDPLAHLGSRTLGECAARVRTKNAGPFWLTIDIFCATDSDYDRVAQSGALTAEVIGQLYRADPATVLLFQLPELRVIKASFPRPVVQGSFADRDMHSGQQYILLSSIPVD